MKTSDVVVAFLTRVGERDRYDVLLFDSSPDARSSERDLSSFARRVPELNKVGTLVDKQPAAIAFSKLQEIVGVYLEGEGSAARLRSVLQPKVPFLGELREGGRHDLRIWLFFEARELEELPWELLADRPARRTVYYRGTPTRAVPAFEVGAAPRVLLLHDGSPRSQDLCNDLRAASGGDVRPATIPNIEAARDYDVLQVVAWAEVGAGYESVLHLCGERRMVASELGRILLGGRTGLLLLSPPLRDSPERTAEGCRAFMHFGQENLQCSIIAPVGPLRDPLHFWTAFHRSLASTSSVEEAFTVAREDAGSVPVVFFLRHKTPRVFRRATGMASPGGDERESTAALAARHAILRQTLAALENVEAQAGPDSRSAAPDALKAARAGLNALEEQLGAVDRGDDDGEL